jgi:hypothetical protein
MADDRSKTRRYRIRSRIIYGNPHRTFYVQRFEGYIDGRESWLMCWRSRSMKDALAALNRLRMPPADDRTGTRRSKRTTR